MGQRGSLPNADLPMLFCVVLLGCVFAFAALGVRWLYTPTVVPNPGLAAYEAPASITVALPASVDYLASAETSALLAAAENNASARAAKEPAKIEASVSERNRKHARRTESRRSRTASRSGRERRILWGYGGYGGGAYAAYGRWY
jgi:hypothetical protein